VHGRPSYAASGQSFTSDVRSGHVARHHP
jgi:hypothetical protein